MQGVGFVQQSADWDHSVHNWSVDKSDVRTSGLMVPLFRSVDVEFSLILTPNLPEISTIRQVDVSSNQLNGTIPSTIGGLTSLAYVIRPVVAFVPVRCVVDPVNAIVWE